MKSVQSIFDTSGIFLWSNPSAKFQTVHTGHYNIAYDNIRFVFSRRFESLHPVLGFMDFKLSSEPHQ